MTPQRDPLRTARCPYCQEGGRDPLAAAPQCDAGQDLAHDPVRDERGDVGRADPGRDHLDDVRPDELDREAISRTAHSRSTDVIPPGSGVPVPGAKAGSRTSTSTVRNDRPRADDAERALDDLSDPELAHVVHEEAT